jgi:hypothetical protein
VKWLERLRLKAGAFCGTALVAIVLTGCAHEPVRGEVVDKTYDDPDFYMMPVSHCVPTGKTTVCSTTYVPHTDPERYLLVVEDSEGKRHDVAVSPFAWEDTVIGSHFEEERE